MNNGPFKVGEICIGQNHVVAVHRNGMECEIVSGLMERLARDGRNDKVVVINCYRVKWSDGQITLALPAQLRRKQPPKREIDTVVSWEDCMWKPQRVPA